MSTPTLDTASDPPPSSPGLEPTTGLDPTTLDAQAAAALFHATFHMTPAAQAITELTTGRIVDANPAYCRLMGYTRAELIGRTAAELNIWVDPEERQELVRRMLVDGYVADYEILVRTQTGEIRSQLASLAPLELRGRRYIVTTGHDITDRKRVEAALRRSEAQHRALLQSLDATIAAVDYAGHILYLNDVAAARLKAPAANLIGRPLRELMGEVESAKRLSAIRRVIDEDTAITVDSLSQLSGTPRWYRTLVRPVRDEHGAPIYAIVISTDIHELKAAQEQLEELNRVLEQRVRARAAEVLDLYENAPAGYHSLDAEGRFVRANRTHLAWLGYSAAEVIGRSFTDFLTPAGGAAFRAAYARFLANGSIHDCECEFVRKDGTVVPTLLNATAIYDETGAYVMSRATVVDITEHRRAADALRAANAEMARALRLRDEFLANISHELRTPLNGVLTLAEVLQEGVYGPLNERQAKTVASIEVSGRHLQALISDLIDIARIDAGKLELDPQRISVDEICQASLFFVRETAQRKQIRLTYTAATGGASLVADGRRVKQMLVNLLSNAVKFTDEGGAVDLSVTVPPEAGTVEFAVSDTGIGIPPEDLPRLFQPFVQLDSSLTRRFGGSGLGLALVKRLATQHGGTVRAESTGIPGAGSTFTLSLPLTPPAPLLP